MLTIKPPIVFSSPPLLHVTNSPPPPSPFRFPTSNAAATLSSTPSLKFRVSSSSPNPTAKIARSTSVSEEEEEELESGAHIVRKFYEGVNRQDLAAVEELIAEKCVYEDLVFPTPFVGRKDILQFFGKFNDSVGKELQFVIDDLSTDDSAAVGATWHLEWNGKPFPFSKGCSFYRLEVINGKRQIIYGRDSVEPAIKPGESVLVSVRDSSYQRRGLVSSTIPSAGGTVLTSDVATCKIVFDILQFFGKFNDSVGKELQFVIDDLSTDDSAAVGATWHLEWNGKPFPFSKGCSFYRLEVINGKRQIIYGRDSVEPAIKPGESVLVAIRGVAWLLRQFPHLAERF